MSKRAIVPLGIAATLGFAGLWHGPLGAGNRLKQKAEAEARRTLDRYEMYQIQADLQSGPLTRRLVLSGPADDFQRAELIRILDATPGVVDVRWDPPSLPQERRIGQ